MRALRELPSVDEVLSRPAIRALRQELGDAPVKAAVRAALAAVRSQLLQSAPPGGAGAALLDDAALAGRARALVAPKLRRVINATGVVLHTNLGRAPLHRLAVARAAQVASGASSLEIDLSTGKRGHRADAVGSLLCQLVGGEAAFAVNNCAGAALLALSALGRGGVAVVSRGELVEIGGGFRVPEILALSGCRLIEVGTTNRTRLADYAAALDALPPDDAGRALILRVHRSNFAVVGFTEEPSLADLARLARARKLPLLYDLGSGALTREVVPGAPQPTVRESLAAGADLLLFSGDKLLGGPQAGLVVGRADLVSACRAHPLARALRLDRMLLAALEATLELHWRGRGHELPALSLLGRPADELLRAAQELAQALVAHGLGAEVRPTEGQVGGGSAPLARLPGYGVALPGLPVERILKELRCGEASVFGRAEGGCAILDLRAVLPEDFPRLAEAVRSAAERAVDRAQDLSANDPTGAKLVGEEEV